MNLTSFIDESPDLRAKLKQEFAKPDFQAKVSIKAPPLTNNHSLIGTAFDYLLRFYLQKLNSCAKARPRWVAEKGLLLLQTHSRFEQAKATLANAKELHAAYISSGTLSKPDRELIESCVRLAYLDTAYRVRIADENLFKKDVPSLIVDDLEAIMELVRPDDFHGKERCLLNPTFGSASELVGGADADLIIDDRLIDLKCNKHLKFDREIFNQLAGYYVLSCIGEIDGCPRGTIKSLAVYFSRFGLMHQVKIHDCIDQNRIPALLEWFKNHAREFKQKQKINGKKA